MNERTALLRRLQMSGFCVLDAVLFLDTHPDDKKALMYYKKCRDAYAELAETFESTFGPLTIGGVNCDTWNWVECPWPWELEAN